MKRGWRFKGWLFVVLLFIGCASYNRMIYKQYEKQAGGVASASDSYAGGMEALTESEYEEKVKKSMFAVLYFTASWCGPCRQMEPVIHRVASSLSSRKMRFFKVDLDVERGLVNQFGVHSVPTTIILIKGVEADRKSGAILSDEVLEGWISDAVKCKNLNNPGPACQKKRSFFSR